MRSPPHEISDHVQEPARPRTSLPVASWVVSLVFAGFLIGLGGKIVGELPGVQQSVSIQQFMDPARTARIAMVRDSLNRLERDLSAAQERARLTLTAASNAYRARRESFDNWIATRVATTDPRQDPEVLRRTAELDQLKAGERSSQTETERLDGELLRVNQALQAQSEAESALELAASSRYERARFRQELRVFGIRLVITLPLLLLAAWLVIRQRRSQYWPLYRGFVMFALFAFFVELVPYLPSYGGYVRYGVGVVASALAGLYVIRAMRRYVAKRAEVEQQTESERRQSTRLRGGAQADGDGRLSRLRAAHRAVHRGRAVQLLRALRHDALRPLRRMQRAEECVLPVLSGVRHSRRRSAAGARRGDRGLGRRVGQHAARRLDRARDVAVVRAPVHHADPHRSAPLPGHAAEERFPRRVDRRDDAIGVRVMVLLRRVRTRIEKAHEPLIQLGRPQRFRTLQRADSGHDRVAVRATPVDQVGEPVRAPAHGARRTARSRARVVRIPDSSRSRRGPRATPRDTTRARVIAA